MINKKPMSDFNLETLPISDRLCLSNTDGLNMFVIASVAKQSQLAG